MRIALAVSVSSPARTIALVSGAFCALLSAPHAAKAQGAATPAVSAHASQRWELRFPSGALVPTGAQRDVLKNAALSAVQLSYAVRPQLALTATLGWARSRDLVTVGDPKVDAFSYDLGAEARAPQWYVSRTLTFSPFVGAGVGAKSYNYRKLDVDATHNVAGYAAAGGELGRGRVRVRLEMRDYVGGFKPLGGRGASTTQNDVVAMFGVTFARRGS